MLKYDPKHRDTARRLRREMTDAEQRLWSRLRRRQILDVQVYRQRPIGSYIVDFYAPRAKLVIEVDGAQHFESAGRAQDAARSNCLEQLGLLVLRFDNRQVLQETDAVIALIHRVVETRL